MVSVCSDSGVAHVDNCGIRYILTGLSSAHIDILYAIKEEKTKENKKTMEKLVLKSNGRLFIEVDNQKIHFKNYHVVSYNYRYNPNGTSYLRIQLGEKANYNSFEFPCSLDFFHKIMDSIDKNWA